MICKGQLLICRIYLTPQCYARLTKEVRQAIEERAWNWAYLRSRVSSHAEGTQLSSGSRLPGRGWWRTINAAMPAWETPTSENHNAGWVSSNLLAATVLRKAAAPYGPQAKLGDGHTVEEHYQAWVAYWKEYFRQRAREGINCEIAHPSSYGMATLRAYYDVTELGESPKLKKIGTDFLNLYWAHVACEFEPRTGIRAAWASTRCYKHTWHETGAIYWARPLLYAYNWHHNDCLSNLQVVPFLASNYRPPGIVSAIASNDNRQPYLATARRFGLAGNIDGVRHVLFEDGNKRNSYIRRSIWYTPDYTISTLSFDPARTYFEPVRQSRVMGVTFSSDVNDRVMVYGFGGKHANDSTAKARQVCSCTTNGVGGVGCMIVARDPGADVKDGIRIFISQGDLWNNRTESQDGWLFTRAGNAFCGIRIAAGAYTVKPSPFKAGYYLALKDIWSPVLIQMGRADDFKGGFEEFKKAAKALPHSYDDGKLSYTSLAGDKYEYWSNSTNLPKINGTEVNLNPANTYDYPYLKMRHGSDVATISYPGYNDLVLNFAY